MRTKSAIGKPQPRRKRELISVFPGPDPLLHASIDADQRGRFCQPQKIKVVTTSLSLMVEGNAIMERRCDLRMGNAVDVAISTLTADDHVESLRVLGAAQVPLEITSRVIFSLQPHRAGDRRKDALTATVIERARGILQCSSVQDAREYLLMKQVSFHLIQRALYDARHRDP